MTKRLIWNNGLANAVTTRQPIGWRGVTYYQHPERNHEV